MLEFAVQVKGLHEGDQATWVLAVDPTAGVLIAHMEDKTLHWYPLEDCTFVKLIPPDRPRPVFPVELAQKGPVIAKPGGLRALERNGG